MRIGNLIRNLSVAGMYAALELTLPTSSVHAQPPTRIIVMADDSGGGLFQNARDSEPFRRLVASVSEQLKRAGYGVVDENQVRTALGFGAQKWASKSKLIDAGYLMNNSDDAMNHARLLALVRFTAKSQDKDFAHAIDTRVNIETYDLNTHEFVAEREVAKQNYPAPASCDDECLRDVVADKARSLGEQAGSQLKLMIQARIP